MNIVALNVGFGRSTFQNLELDFRIRTKYIDETASLFSFSAKRQRTVQVMELHDLPKQGIGHRNPHVKPGNQRKQWGQGRR